MSKNMTEQKRVEYHINGNEWIQAHGGDIIVTTGSGGGGGGKGGGNASVARAAVEAANTLQASAVVKIIEVLAEGQIEGLCGGAKGIYINDTPLQNSDGSYNFTNVLWDYRVGLPDQDYMQGFSNVEAEISVATDVSIASNNIVRTVSATNIDAVRVTIQLPNGLSSQDTTTGDINGSVADIRIDRKLTSSGTWAVAGYYEIYGKTMNPYEVQYLIDRPGASGTWDVRVVRLNADPGANVNNQTRFERLTEIQYIQLQYDDTAYVGVAINAESVGNSIPHRSYLVKGARVQIPSNYNPVTRVYTGIWNGTFTTAWTDNPAWCLYDMLTNTRYGMGEFVSASNVEKYSFYDAGVYSDELVNDGNGGTEPRFTFNARIAAQDQFWRAAYLCAGTMHSTLVYLNSMYVLIQDRPSDPVKTISKDNVINGKFKRKSSSREERHTAVNVTWNNRADRHLQVVSTVEDTAGIARYGYYPVDIAAYGATTEGQAIRHGKYVLYTELNQVHQVAFEMTFDGFDLIQGDVIKILDEDWANIQQAGRLTTAIGAGGTTVVFDRPITITPGSTVSITMPDGSGIQTRAINETSGVRSSVTILTNFTMVIPVDSQFLVETSTVSAKQYKIMGVKQTDINVVEVQCVEHDPTKYSFIETGIAVPSPIFSNAIRTVVLPPTLLVFAEESSVLPNGNPQRNLRLTWTPPLGTVKGYKVVWCRENGEVTTTFTALPQLLITAEQDGSYYFDIFSTDYNNNNSGTALPGEYVFDSSIAASSILGDFNPVVDLYVTGTSGLIWAADDLIVSWIDDVTNTVPTVSYKVEVKTTLGVLLHTEEVFEKSFNYSLWLNTGEGGPRASVIINVYPRDASSRYGPVNTKTFTNPPPAAVSGLGVIGSYKSVSVSWGALNEPDLKGYLVWRSTTAGFTPSGGNLISDQTNNVLSDIGLANATTYYYKVAAYDFFSRNEVGTGLNVVATSAALTLDENNTNEYLLNGVTWTPNSPSVNSVAWSAATVVKTGGTSSGASWSITAGNAAWTSGVLYVYYIEGETILRSTSSVAAAIADNKIIVATYRGGTNLEVGNGKAYMDGGFIIAGTIAAAQLVTGTAVITQTAQIANAIIDNAKIVDATIDTLKLKNGSVTSYSTFYNSSVAVGQSSSNAPTVNQVLVNVSVTPGSSMYTPTPIGLTGPFSGLVHVFIDVNRNSSVPITVEMSVTVSFYNADNSFRTSVVKTVINTMAGTVTGTVLVPVMISQTPGEITRIGTVAAKAYSVGTTPINLSLSVGPVYGCQLINLR
jgi:hypothetical protein